jgi:hypothetical protein
MAFGSTSLSRIRRYQTVSRFANAVKAGFRAMQEDRGPKAFAAAGRQIRCGHCGGTRFRSRDLLLDGRGASLVGLEWLSDGAVALICAECSAIQWFAGRPQPLDQ